MKHDILFWKKNMADEDLDKKNTRGIKAYFFSYIDTNLSEKRDRIVPDADKGKSRG